MDGILFFRDLNLFHERFLHHNKFIVNTNNTFRLRQKWAVDTHLPSLMIVQKDAQKNVTLIIGVCISAEKNNGDLTIHCAFHATTVKTYLKL